MNSTFFSTENENIWVEFVEIETKTRGKTDKTRFIFVISSNQFESNHFFRFQFIFHEIPIHHSSIGGNRVEIIFFGNIRIPVDLPDWVGMFLSTNIRLIDRSFMFVSNIINQHSSVIETHSKKCRGARMEIQTHDPTFSSE